MDCDSDLVLERAIALQSRPVSGLLEDVHLLWGSHCSRWWYVELLPCWQITSFTSFDTKEKEVKVRFYPKTGFESASLKVVWVLHLLQKGGACVGFYYRPHAAVLLCFHSNMVQMSQI